MAAQRTLLVWTPDGREDTAGYDVTAVGFAAERALGGMYLDPTVYADDAEADAVEYSVVRVAASGAVPQPDPSSYPAPATGDIDVARIRVPTTVRLCRVYGSLRTVAYVAAPRSEVRFYPYREAGLPLGLGGMTSETMDEAAVWTNCYGEFEIWLVAPAVMTLHVPRAEFAARFDVPDAAELHLSGVALVPVVQVRNN